MRCYRYVISLTTSCTSETWKDNVQIIMINCFIPPIIMYNQLMRLRRDHGLSGSSGTPQEYHINVDSNLSWYIQQNSKDFAECHVHGYLPWVPLLPYNHQHAFHGNDGTSFLVDTSIWKNRSAINLNETLNISMWPMKFKTNFSQKEF